MTVLFWVLLCLLAYTYVGYGLLLMGLASLGRSRAAVPPSEPLSVTLLIAAHNEQEHIAGKIENAMQQDVGEHHLEIVIVSDGSSDRTVEEVRKFAGVGVRLIEITEHNGKTFALNKALEKISTDIVVFSDANSELQHEAIANLLRHFGDPEVGGVCGQIIVPRRSRTWIGLAEAVYWRYDQALKSAENRLAGAVSAQGSLYAIRTELLDPLPSAVADDLINSLRVVYRRKRLVFEPQAMTAESVTGRPRKELQRRIRSTERGWRGLMHMASLLNPIEFGFYSFQLFSHKVLRRLTPFMLIGLALTTLPLITVHPFYAVAAVLQALFYGLAALAWIMPALRRVPGAPFALFFVMGHVAMGLGVINALRGQRTDRWDPVREG